MNAPFPSLADRARPDPGAGAVLALDLGTKTGWACRHVDGRTASGRVEFTPAGHEGRGFRFLRFRAWLTEFKNAAGGLEAVFYESAPFRQGATNATADRVFGGFEAILTSWCEHHRIRYDAINVSTLKKAVTGHGRADKSAVRAAMRAAGFAPASDDEADALAVLTVGLRRMEG